MDTAHYVFSAHAHNLAPYVGKGRQQAARSSSSLTIDALTSDAAARAGYVLYRALVLMLILVGDDRSVVGQC